MYNLSSQINRDYSGLFTTDSWSLHSYFSSHLRHYLQTTIVLFVVITITKNYINVKS